MDFFKKFTESSVPKSESTDKSAPADKSQSDLFSSATLVAEAARSTFQQEPAKHENAEVAGAAANLLDAAQTYGKLDKTAGVGSYVEKAENYLQEYEASHTTKPKTPEEPSSTDEKETKPTTEEPVAKPTSEDIPSQGQEKFEEPTESVKPTIDEPKPSSQDVPSQAEKEEEEPIKEETKPSTEDVPSESQKEEETEPTESTKPTTEEPSYGEKEEEKVPSESTKPSDVKDPETEPASEIPSGVGEYAKIAEGFLKKNKEGDSAEGDSGKSDQIGQYAKVAEGFLNQKSEGTGDSDQGGLGGIAKLAGGLLK